MSDDRMDEFIDEFLLRFKKATGFDFTTGKLCASTVPPQGPHLIQGYTAEQWQEIKKGKYLCEFSGSGNKNRGFLEGIEGGACPFQQVDGSDWTNCRPAQIKGVMRPIFVEPVDKEATVVYFDGSGQVISGSRSWLKSEIPRTLATKYIEV